MTTKIKVIKNEDDYQEALKMVAELMSADPDPNSEDGEKLNLLATLIEEYESKTFPESLPDPIDALLFRMEQQNLQPKDLVPYIGSRSKVSEVLSRKRPLTLSMMRALESGLGIPAKVLLKEPEEFKDEENIVWSRFPVKEMEKHGCFESKLLKNVDIKSVIEKFFQPIGSPVQFLGLLRKSNYRFTRPIDKYALAAWSGCVVNKANKIKFTSVFKTGTVDLAFMSQLVKLSAEETGPILARDYLKKYGIALIIEPYFSQTYLDGATIMTNKEHPIIGLTIRHDRLDNFWFTLMHELAHIALHNDQNSAFFYDNLDNADSNDDKEKQADTMAKEALIPEGKWENSPARLVPSPIAAQSLAKELGINIAIVAGKMRYENDRYQYLNTIINQAKVRKYFPEEKWSE